MRLLLLVVLVGCGSVARAAGTSPPPDVKCGAYCLFVGLKSLDLVTGPFSAFEKNLGQPGAEGYSLADLERFAREQGASTQAIAADLDTLLSLNKPSVCIALLDDHFVILKSFDNATKVVSVIDPPREYDQPVRAFRSRFTGNALILSTTPVSFGRSRTRVIVGSCVAAALIAAVGFMTVRFWPRGHRVLACRLLPLACGFGLGCGHNVDRPTEVEPTSTVEGGLRIEPAIHQVGKVFAANPQRNLTLVTRLVNPSSVPIHLREIRKSCTCTEATLESNTVPPGGQVKLTSVFELRLEPGPNRVSVHVVSDDAPDEPRQITFDWDLITPLFADQPRCDAGRLEPGQPARRTVDLRDRGLPLCVDCRVAAEPRIVGRSEPSGRHEPSLNSRDPLRMIIRCRVAVVLL